MVDKISQAEQETITKLPHSLVSWCSVPINEVIALGKLLKAGAYNPKARQARALVSSCKWKKVPLCGDKGLATAYVCVRFKRKWVEKSDYPIYQPASMNNVYPLPNEYLSSNTKTDLNKLRVKRGQVLLSCGQLFHTLRFFT